MIADPFAEVQQWHMDAASGRGQLPLPSFGTYLCSTCAASSCTQTDIISALEAKLERPKLRRAGIVVRVTIMSMRGSTLLHLILSCSLGCLGYGYGALNLSLHPTGPFTRTRNPSASASRQLALQATLLEHRLRPHHLGRWLFLRRLPDLSMQQIPFCLPWLCKRVGKP